VMLTDCQGHWKGMTMSDGDGHYEFTDLEPGGYKVKFAAPLGYLVAPTHAGGNPNLDNDVNQGWTGFTDCITLNAGQERTDIDAGFISIFSDYAGSASILNLSLSENKYVAQLTWQNNTGAINDYFLIQRSTDNIYFENIGQVKSEETTRSTNYEFTDNSPKEGENFYRIVAITLTGNSLVSNQVSGIFKQGKAVEIYPNPATDLLNINLKAFAGQPVDILLSTPVGITAKSIHIDEATDAPIQIDLHNLQNGFYQVQIRSNSGQMVTKKLVIEKLD